MSASGVGAAVPALIGLAAAYAHTSDGEQNARAYAISAGLSIQSVGRSLG